VLVPPGLADLPQQADLLRRVAERFDSDVRVTALVLSGSLARAEGDIWSDVDVYVVTADQDFADVFAERSTTAAEVGHPLAQFTVPGAGGGSTDLIVLYDDLVKLDLMYYHASEVQPHLKWVDVLVLKDVHGLIGDVQQRSQTLAVAALTDEQLLLLDQQFWVWCLFALGKIRRGERWAALDALHEIRTAAVIPVLLAVRQQRDEGYRRLETKLRDDEGALIPTIASLEANSQLAALRQEVALFTSARTSLFAKRGLTINEAAETVIRSALA
jgi:predicted nucleotidyltransferase